MNIIQQKIHKYKNINQLGTQMTTAYTVPLYLQLLQKKNSEYIFSIFCSTELHYIKQLTLTSSKKELHMSTRLVKSLHIGTAHLYMTSSMNYFFISFTSPSFAVVQLPISSCLEIHPQYKRD